MVEGCVFFIFTFTEWKWCWASMLQYAGMLDPFHYTFASCCTRGWQWRYIHPLVVVLVDYCTLGTKTKNEQSHKKFKSYLLSGTNSVSKKRDFVESLCSLIVAMSSFYKFHLHLVFRKGLAEKSILYFFRILRNKPTIIATVVSLVEHDTILYETHYYYS